ncbi:hypothetical protein WQ56_04605 [Luteimonas sp. FCS-9]|nr:hypothetical protein WQ56_04605 [Luteimonas sp. FCS-9]
MLGELGELLLLPAGAAFGEDALQEFSAGFLGLATGSAPIGRQGAFHRSRQQRLAVLRHLALRGLQFRHASVEIGKQFFQLFDDATLFSIRSQRNAGLTEHLEVYAFLSCALSILNQPVLLFWCIERVRQITRFRSV